MNSTSSGLLCLVVFAGAALAGCTPSRSPGARRPLEAPPETRIVGRDAASLYNSVGLAAASSPVPFVGSAGHFASETPDTTLTLLTISLSNRALTFAREGERYRAPYAVEIKVVSQGVEVNRIDALEVVRVATFRETGRTDESIIFQRWLRLTPGAHALRLAVRDVGSGRTSTDTLALAVPRFGPGGTGVSTPVPVYEARPRTRLDTLPSIVPRPRATAIFGRDTAMAVYVEGYAEGTGSRLPLSIVIRNDARAITWSDTASLPRQGSLYSGALSVPVSSLGVGIGTLGVVSAGARDTATTPLFLTFGEDLPLAPFEDMLSYLRFFAGTQRLRALRDAPPERRAQLWAEFLRQTDPVPHTAEHEALQAYFARIQLANARFRDDATTGWLSDRGTTFVALGEPDNVVEQTASPSGRRGVSLGPVRVQLWEYRQLRAQLAFSDEETSGRFRFVPRSEGEFRMLLQRILVH